MGLIATLLEFTRTTSGDAQVADCRVDPGGTDDATAHSYQPTGFDGSPLPGDYCLLVPGPEAGSWVVAGFIDPNNAGTAKAGETRLYARDGDGKVVAELHVTADGNPPDGIAAELIARADRAEAALAEQASTFNSHTHNYIDSVGSAATPEPTLTSEPDSAPVSTPVSKIEMDTDPKVGCDKVFIT